MLGKFFGKKKAEATAVKKAFENKDMLEATLAAAVLVAYSDGDCSDDEMSVLIGVVENNDSLSHFGSEIGITLDKYRAMFESGKTLATIKLMREIGDCKHSVEEAEEIFATVIDIAESDGTIDACEVDTLKKIAKALNINAKDFGIE